MKKAVVVVGDRAMELVPATPGDKIALLNLSEYYAYDFSELLGLDVGESGRFAVASLERHFVDPVCHPFLIREAGRLAGFAIHEGRSRLSGELGINDVAELFVMKKYRRLGIGARAASVLFDRFAGPWEVREVRGNVGALAFWRKVIERYSGGAFTESEHDDGRFRGTVQRFVSCRGAMEGKTILETARLTLREMTEADAEHLFLLGQNPKVMRFIHGELPVTSHDDALAVLSERVFPQYALGLGRWACIEKSSGEFLGWCGVKYLADDGEYDIGYRFFERHWGKGYATESAAAVCDFARRHLQGKRVVGVAERDHAASRRVLEKIGLTFEGYGERDGRAMAVYVLGVDADAA